MVSDADVVRQAYKALSERDMETLETLFARDAVWVLPGSSVISGTHVGWPAIRDEFVALLGPLSGGTFNAELLDVAVGERYLVAIQRTTGSFKGRTLDVTSCQLVRIEHGLVTEVSGLYSGDSLERVQQFWV